MSSLKSLAVLEAELVELKASYHQDGVDFDEIKQACNDIETSQKYLKKIDNDKSHPCFAKKKRVVDSQSTKDLASKWRVICKKEQ